MNFKHDEGMKKVSFIFLYGGQLNKETWQDPVQKNETNWDLPLHWFSILIA